MTGNAPPAPKPEPVAEPSPADVEAVLWDTLDDLRRQGRDLRAALSDVALLLRATATDRARRVLARRAEALAARVGAVDLRRAAVMRELLGDDGIDAARYVEALRDEARAIRPAPGTQG
jgi:hypothetical protein